MNQAWKVHLEGSRVIKKGIQRGSEGAWDSAPASSWDADSPIAETPILRLELRSSDRDRDVGGDGFFPRPSRPRRQPQWPSWPPLLRRGLSWLRAKPWNLNLIYRCWQRQSQIGEVVVCVLVMVMDSVS